MPDDERLLRPETVAGKLGISRRTLYRMIERKEINAYRFTIKCYRIPQSELDRLLKKFFDPDE